MRIGVNLQSLNPGAIGGLETYVRSLLEWIPGVDQEITLVLFCVDYNIDTIRPGPGLETRLLSHGEFVALDSEALAAHELSVWFCPFLTLEPRTPGLPSVVTVPDMQHETHPEFFTPELLEWRRRHYLRTVSDADRILTLSAHSKQQIVEFFAIPEEKVVATHLDAQRRISAHPVGDLAYLESVRSSLSLPDRYFYYPANDWPHKNHAFLFEALALFRQRGVEPPPLVLTGARVDPPSDWRPLLQRLDLGRSVRHLGYVPTEMLPGIYSQAEALVLPSLFEGFGIPVVEAMRSRCPVISSNCASLPEIGGDAVLFFDPSDPEELFDQMWRIHQDGSAATSSGLRQKLIAAGLERSKAFSWRRCAEETLGVLREVAGRARAPVVLGADSPLPRISIVTPSLDQGRFLERTLESVLGQGYPNLQHIVVDGGSTDETLEILERYRHSHPDVLEFVSEPDRGQAHAVNKGLDRAGGEIIGWLNSDDTLQPGALLAVASAFLAHPEWQVVFGNAAWISEDDAPILPYPTLPSLDFDSLEDDCQVCQPSVFWRRSLVEQGMRLDESLHWCMDYELWIRLIRETPFHFLNRSIANSRVYSDTKTLGSRREVFREIFATGRRHYGRVSASWILGRAAFICSGDPSFFDPPVLDSRTYRRALVDLIRFNWRSPCFLWRELTRGHGRQWLREVLGKRPVTSGESAREASA